MNDHDLFELILDQPEPDFPSVVDAAVADGRRVRRRRRMAASGAGVAVLAIASAGLFLVPSHQASVGPAAPVPPAATRVPMPTMPSGPPSSPSSPTLPTSPTSPTWPPPSISSTPPTQAMPSGPEATAPTLDAAESARRDDTREQENVRPESGVAEPESNKPTGATPLDDAGAVACMPARTGKCTSPGRN